MVLDHNLGNDEAERECQQLRRDKFPAFTLEQKGKHRAHEAEDCKACSKLVAEKSKEIKEKHRREENASANGRKHRR
jgi:hypothetical protein